MDVLGILVKANYKYIPSLDDILEAAAVARLRNQLLESEYYQLAVEVSLSEEESGVRRGWHGDGSQVRSRKAKRLNFESNKN